MALRLAGRRLHPRGLGRLRPAPAQPAGVRGVAAAVRQGSEPWVTATPRVCLHDVPTTLRVGGLAPHANLTLAATLADETGREVYVTAAAVLVVCGAEALPQQHHNTTTTTNTTTSTTTTTTTPTPTPPESPAGKTTKKEGVQAAVEVEGRNTGTGGVEDTARSKRQWFLNNFPQRFSPSDYQGSHPSQMSFSSQYYASGFHPRAWWGMSDEEVMAYRRWLEENWQHRQWLYDMWRRSQGLPLTPHHPMMFPGYPYPLPNPSAQANHGSNSFSHPQSQGSSQNQHYQSY